MADPGQLAAGLLQKNFSKFGSFRQLTNYRSKAATSYDPVTGIVSPGADQDYSLHAIFDSIGSFSEMQIDDNAVLAIDRMAIFPALDLPITPKIGDEMTDEANTVWRVVGVQSDPKPAHFSLHVRPLSDG